MTLSDAARSCWGKSWPAGGRPIERWAPLWRHLQDSASVAGRLWDDWLPRSVTEQVAAACGGEISGRTFVTFLAGVHDIGKATPAFAVQVGRLRDQMVQLGLPMPRVLPERSTRPHSLAGQVVLERWLAERHGWTPREAASLGSVVGAHHGIPPSQDERASARGPLTAGTGLTRNGELLGVGPWRAVQDELLDHMARRTAADRFLSEASWRRVPRTVLALALGVVVVADWLASNIELFPLVGVTEDVRLPQPNDDDDARTDAAWAAVRLPSPWMPGALAGDLSVLLAERFSLPDGSPARPVQRAVVEAAREMAGPGIVVIEAPMGEGKTESALLAAEILGASSGSGGLLVALPTQATSDAMFGRVMRWIARLPTTTEGQPLVGKHSATERRAVFLAHGKAWLNPDFAAVPRSRTGAVDVGRDVESPATPRYGHGGVYVDAWMTGRRKGVLADFVVGTVDQVLFGALQARHVALRHLALARKVVVLDEVHAFDAYMNSYLERALEWLGAYGVPVIALSATLPPSLRARLVGAYQRGRHHTVTSPARTSRGRARLALGGSSIAPEQPASSRVTFSAPDGGVRTRPVDPSSRMLTVHVETAPDDDAQLVALLVDATRDGGCVLVVRNTVRRAQETYVALARELGQDVVLLHSRFLAADRKERERRLVRELGPPPRDGGPGDRPHRLVVVGTQVVEQSLDIDVDLLVTDLAPTDLLLQRIGRLHRHDRPPAARPARLREARAVVVGADWTADLPTFPSGSIAVYREHLLLRAAAQVRALETGAGSVRLPTDIAPLVHEAYADTLIGPESWAEHLDRARRAADDALATARARAATFRLPAPGTGEPGLVGWLDASVGEADVEGARAQVRDGEDSIEVLVVQRDAQDEWYLPPWSDSAPHAGEQLTKSEIPPVSLRRALAGTSLRLPMDVAAGPRGDAVVGFLESLVVEPWQDSPDLAGQLVLPFDADGRADLPGVRLRYDPKTGLRHEVER